MRKFLLPGILLLAIVFCGHDSYSQDFSNKGKDFWVGYGSHCDMYNTNGTMNSTGGAQDMVLYFATDRITNVTVSIPTIGYTQTYSNIAANTIFETPIIPKSGANDARLGTEGTLNKGIHITSDQPIVAYAHIYNGARSGATLLFPTNTLGKEYYSLNFSQYANQNYSYCWFYVVATDTGTTTIQVTPSANTQTMVAGTTYTINLTQGQIFNALGSVTGVNGVDLTGSKILSISSGSGGCKKIAVFSGSGKISISCPVGSGGSADNYIVQSLPKTAWGKSYLTVPTAGQPFNYYRIAVSDPTAVVQLNGATLTGLINNFYYQVAATNQPVSIQSDKPIMVAQYITSTGVCGNNVGIPANEGDPEVIYLSSIEQNISNVLLNATPHYAINEHFVSVLVPNGGTGVSSFRLDGAIPSASFVVHPQNPAYSYLQQAVTVGTHTLVSDSGFNASAYGYGNVESYGYNAGTNVRDLYQFVSIYNQYATVPFPAGCRNSPLQFSMTFPYQPTEIRWIFGTALNAMGIADVTLGPSPPPVFTSTSVVNGRTLYEYKLPLFYTITASGTYPIKVIAFNPTPDGCSGLQEINYDLQIFDPPDADFTFDVVCLNQATSFFDNSNTGGRPVISRHWDFGDASTSNVYNPTHLYAASGSYTVKYSLITDVGCLSDTAEHIVAVNPLPTAGISGSTTVCQGAASPSIWLSAVIGTPPITFTYNINGGPNQTAVSGPTNTLAILTVPTTTPNTYIYNLISVQDANGCSQAQPANATVVVKPLPTATISGNNEVCQNATFPSVVFTGAGATAPYTFTYNINGGTNQTVTSVGNNATITINTTIPGNYVVNLVSVQDASIVNCSQSQPASVTIKVNPLPTAIISGTTEVCQNAPMPLITFTGAGGTSPYTFTYTVNGGSPQTVISVGDIATVAVNTSVVNTFTYTLTGVQDATATLCSQLQSGSATITVNPLPTSNFNFTAPSCATRTIDFHDLSVPNVGNIITWQWDFGDGSPVITINAPTNPDITHSFAAAGTYNVTLTTTTDKGCVSVTPPQQVVIHPRPKAGYIAPEVCLNDTYAQFIDTSTVATPDAIVTWQWNFGDPGSGPLNTSTLQNPQHSYTATGAYNAQLIITSNNGCKDTIVQALYVNGSFPVANFLVPNPTALCANDSVSIVEASTVFPGFITKVEIYWDNVGQPGVFDTDNFPVPGKVYKHLYPNFQSPLTKTYTIRYRAYSGGVCVNDKISNITVNAAPLVQFNNIPNICLDATPYQITQGSEIGGVPGSGAYSGPGVSPGGLFNPAIAGPGLHTILYTFTSTTGGCVDTMSNTILVYDPPLANFSYSSPDCETKAVTFTDNSVPSVGTLTTWTWDFGDGTPLVVRNNNSPFPHTFAVWGVYQVKLFVTTSNGCKSVVKTIPVTIHPQPKPDFSTPVSSCLPNATVTFSDLSTIADGTQASFTYLWNFGDPASGPLNTSTLANPSHIYTTVGPFNVNLQVTSGNGCIHDTTIVLSTVHPQPLASFTVDKVDVCIGGTILFTNTSNAMDGFPTQYNWTMGDGNVRNLPTFSYVYSNLGTYDVSLFIFNNHGCRSTTYTKTVSVNPYPPVNAGPDKFVLQGGQIILTPVLTATMPVTYQWTPSQYLNNPTIPNAIASPPDDITYTLRITTDKGCSATDQVFIKVLKLPAIPNIFSPNGDGTHDKWVIDYLDSYPGCTVDIFNRYGQLIWHSDGYTNPWDGTINGKPVPVGTYYYIVSPKNGRKQMAGYVDVIR